jgi:hypothetical protein
VELVYHMGELKKELGGQINREAKDRHTLTSRKTTLMVLLRQFQ